MAEWMELNWLLSQHVCIYQVQGEEILRKENQYSINQSNKNCYFSAYISSREIENSKKQKHEDFCNLVFFIENC